MKRDKPAGPKSLAKVVAFVTRGHGSKKQLLVFRHPSAGIQVPAGTVKLGESPEEAVLREAFEESGLAGLQLEKELGSMTEELPADRRLVLRATKIFNEPSFDASSEGFGLIRGSIVIVAGRHGSFSRIIGDPLDLRQDPPRRLSGITGYVRTSLLGARVIRHFFLLLADEATPDSWEVDADGHLFLLYWVPLAPPPNLIAPQAAWLDRYMLG